MPLQPLEEGEYIDLDTGTRVQRREGWQENVYYIKLHKNGTQRIELEDEEIREIAELAGYEVRDPPEI